MKKRWALIGLILFLAGCSMTASPDLEGTIYELTDSGVKIAIIGDDPEAEYPVYEIAIDDSTIIEHEGNGEQKEIDLAVDDWIEIWLVEENAEQKVAEKIKVRTRDE